MSKELTPFGNKVCPKNCAADCNECETIANIFRDAEKYKKAVEILKNKKVDIECEITKTTDYTDYLAEWRDYLEEDELLTQEEYELLKEILK